jgi:hypothetical protein
VTAIASLAKIGTTAMGIVIFQILVNAGSDRRDVLGLQTQVYFTTQPLEISNLDRKNDREIVGYKN